MSKAKSKRTGRPSKFDPSKIEQAYKLALLGATDKQMADFWEVTEQTLNNWKTAHPAFFESLKAGKIVADGTVVQSLYQRANGYSHAAVKIHWDKDGAEYRANYTEHYPPDTTAAIFWLKNRQPALWRDKTENTTQLVGDGNKPLDMPELARELAFILQSGVQALEEKSPEPLH